MDSILTSIKKMLGIPEEYEHFDLDLIIHINTVLSILAQIGVGPYSGYSISDSSNTWDEFIPSGKNLETIKTYVYLRVRLLFDPPQSGTAAEAINRMISELEWRISVNVDPGTPLEE